MNLHLTDTTTDAPIEDDRPSLPKGARWLDDGSVHLDLERPVTLGGSSSAGTYEKHIDHLVFRDLDGGALIDMGGYRTSGARMAFLIGTSTGHTGPAGERVVRGLRARDFRRAELIIDIFTDAGLTIGNPAS